MTHCASSRLTQALMTFTFATACALAAPPLLWAAQAFQEANGQVVLKADSSFDYLRGTQGVILWETKKIKNI